MSFIKTVFSIFVILPFIIILLIFQIYMAFSFTVFSESFFNKVLDSSGITSGVSQYAFSKLDNPEIKGENGETNPELARQFKELASILKSSIDRNWLETQLSTLIKGFHAYMFADGSQLPVLDIIPVKSAFIEIITQQVIQHGNVGDSKEMQALARSELSKKLKLEDIKDTLDLNLLVKSAFDNDYNYPEGIKKIISAVRKALVLDFLIIIALLIAILVFVHFKPKSVLRFSASAFWAAGLPILAAAVIVSTSPTIKETISALKLDAMSDQPELANSIQSIIRSFTGGFINYLVIFSVILIFLGILCITASSLKTMNINPIKPPKHKALIRAIRSFAILAAVLLIPVTASWSYNNISTAVMEFKSHIEGSSNPLKSVNILEALAEATGADFLKENNTGVQSDRN